MKNKRLILSFAACLCSPLLGSWSNPGTISIEVCSFTKYKKASDPNTVIESTGHSFITVFNNTSSNIKVGYYTLEPNDAVSVGLWQKGAGGGSSSGGSSGGSSSGSSSGADFNGIYYNKEFYYYNSQETIVEPKRYESVISSSTLNSISNIIRNKNDTYSLLTYNCAHFATEIWKIVDPSANWYNGWFRTPGFLRDDIQGKYGSAASSSSPFTTKSKFRHYTSSTSYVETVH